ncbi:MAG: ATP-binding protein [Holophagales bacterium]|jgi:anti-sigma regulatory factor (Ser/Thr protein kinase)|nr:ATP-binding protein [Holophagales bacterium]
MYHDAELHSSLELVIDVTPQTRSTSQHINNCVEFLESKQIDNESLLAFSLLISEALANAIEHGILRLSSSLKEDPCNDYGKVLWDCFDTASGQVSLKVKLLHENGNCDLIKAISVEVTDSGSGFDWRGKMRDAAMPTPDKPSGRGLALIKMIASHVNFNESGNTIQFIIPCLPDEKTLIT